MLAHEIKQYIVENNLLITLLNKMEFHNIKERETSGDKWISCSWKDGDNPNGIQVKCDNLYVKTYTHTNINSDIFELIGYVYKLDFINSLRKAHQLLGLDYNTQPKSVKKKSIDILLPLKKYKVKNIGNSPIQSYPATVLQSYKQTNWIEWIKQGISNTVAKEFLVCYDPLQERMLLPYRSLDPQDNEIIGITGRSLLSAEICKEFNIPKYICVVPYNFKKSQTLYGYAENYSHIIQKGEVLVGESEKMVLQRASVFDRTCVGIGGHDLSQRQVQLLIGLNVNIVIALDKDIPETFIKEQCEKFKGIRNVSYIIDKDNLLGDKDAPVDKGNEVYQKLYNNKIKYISIESQKENNNE